VNFADFLRIYSGKQVPDGVNFAVFLTYFLEQKKQYGNSHIAASRKAALA